MEVAHIFLSQVEVPFVKFKLLLVKDPLSSLLFFFLVIINKTNTELLMPFYFLLVAYLSA